ncbi:MAG TPA: type VII secretion integral membrane protein EccD [Micromonosporaceae bacterium]|nr:type VII secretion integral membrane protein EccD [Micromonosporaceae bacterium]
MTTANTGAGLARVVIVGPSRRLSLALPERVPLATLLPSVLAQAGEQVEQGPSDKPVGQPVTGWALRRSDGVLLDPTRPLATQDIRDGEVLHLVARDADWPEPEYDDIVEAIAAGARRSGIDWTAPATRRAGLIGAAGVLVVALVMVLRAGPPWVVPAGVLIGAGVALILTGMVLSRAAGDSGAGAVFGALGLPYLFVGSLVVLAGPTDAVTELGAPHLLLAGVVTLLGGILGQLGVSDAPGVFVAAVVAGGAAVLGALVGLTSLDGAQAAALVLALLTLLHPALPLLAVRLGKVPIPTIPQTPEDLLRDEAMPSTIDVFTAARRADRLLIGFVAGVSVASAVCLAMTARAGGIAAPLLAGIASVSLLLRARAWRTVQLRVPMLLAGGFGVALLILGIADSMGYAVVLGVLLPILLLAATAVAAAGLIYSRRAPSPYPGRIADILDVVLVLSVVPVAVAVLGMYGGVLDVMREFLQ